MMTPAHNRLTFPVVLPFMHTDLSGLYVKKADRDARIPLVTIMERFKRDFAFIPQPKESEVGDDMPAIALIIGGHEPVAMEDTSVKSALIEEPVIQETTPEAE